MEIILQTNNSEDNAINKSLYTVASLSGSMRQESSIINPTFMIETDISTMTKVNYLTIPSFGRSYYVKDITSLRTNLVQVTCHVDVLESFKSQILSRQAVLARQESDYNLYMDDSDWYINCKKQRQIKNFPNVFSSQGSLVITTIGGNV